MVTLVSLLYKNFKEWLLILAVDVAYQDSRACVAGVLFEKWNSTEPTQVLSLMLDGVAEYQPGAFYLRELPCISRLLVDVPQPLSAIVIDGYVQLGQDQHAGLGLHLWHSLNKQVPVIGVAKTWFKDTPQSCELLRGKSNTPLYITAAGMDLAQAKTHIASMAGQHRIPAILKLVDRQCRAGIDQHTV